MTRRVVVAVCTYRRPAPLRRLLEALLPQARAAGAEVLVVDNDPVASAQVPDGVRLVHEPRPGIAAARNQALDEAGDADALVFVDDDETPEPGWLAALLTTWTSTGASVAGPVASVLEDGLPAWVEAGGWFERRRLPTAARIEVAATNNLLLDLAAVRRLGLRFDDRFGTTGGSDSLFTRSLTAGGAPLVWCAEARVLDHVPADRTTRRWVLARALRVGATESRVERVLDPGPGPAARQAARGAVRLAGGSAQWLVGTVRGDLRWQSRGARTAARGAGMLGGCWGWSVQEYRR